jgi:hypothetical protein
VVVAPSREKPNKVEDDKWKQLQIQMESAKKASKQTDESILEEMDDFGRANPLQIKK